jgi:hypothetical protein
LNFNEPIEHTFDDPAAPPRIQGLKYTMIATAQGLSAVTDLPENATQEEIDFVDNYVGNFIQQLNEQFPNLIDMSSTRVQIVETPAPEEPDITKLIDEFVEKAKIDLAKAEAYAKETGQDPLEMLMPLTLGNAPGATEKGPQSISEFNTAGDVMRFVCVRTAEANKVPGSVVQTCDGCRRDVWMSPATTEVFDKISKKIITCVECVEEEMAKKAAKAKTEKKATK